MRSKHAEIKEARTAICSNPKVAVQYLNQTLCLVDSEVLLNRLLRVAANRRWAFARLIR